MQKEVSEVLQEMQTTIMAITQTYSTALKVLVERADKIDKELAKHNLSKETPKNETGIEL
jgi:Ulp1 family protease